MTMSRSSLLKIAAAGAVASVALFGTASASANGVSWSVGVNVPGVAIGVAAPQPYYVAPQRYYAPPPQAYYPPAPVYYQQRPPVYYNNVAPVYYAPPPPVYYGPGPGYYHRHQHRRDWR